MKQPYQQPQHQNIKVPVVSQGVQDLEDDEGEQVLEAESSPSLSTMLLQLVDVAEGGAITDAKATLTAIMPHDGTGSAQAMVGKIARIKQAMEVLHNHSMELAFHNQRP